jgi:putative DNA primase/helicase
VKALSGQDVVSARFLHQEFFDFVPTFKVYLATNHRPVIRGTDKAIWSRVRLVPFQVAIPETEQDKSLLDKLRAERSGILNWMMAGCLAWQRHGLGTCEDVTTATADYRAEQDILGVFLADRCIGDPVGHVTRKELFTAYKEWAEETAERHVLTDREFASTLRERDFSERKVKGTYEWRGLRLRTMADIGADEVPRIENREEVNLDAH